MGIIQRTWLSVVLLVSTLLYSFRLFNERIIHLAQHNSNRKILNLIRAKGSETEGDISTHKLIILEKAVKFLRRKNDELTNELDTEKQKNKELLSSHVKESDQENRMKSFREVIVALKMIIDREREKSRQSNQRLTLLEKIISSYNKKDTAKSQELKLEEKVKDKLAAIQSQHDIEIKEKNKKIETLELKLRKMEDDARQEINIETLPDGRLVLSGNRKLIPVLTLKPELELEKEIEMEKTAIVDASHSIKNENSDLQHTTESKKKQSITINDKNELFTDSVTENISDDREKENSKDPTQQERSDFVREVVELRQILSITKVPEQLQTPLNGLTVEEIEPEVLDGEIISTRGNEEISYDINRNQQEKAVSVPNPSRKDRNWFRKGKQKLSEWAHAVYDNDLMHE